VFSTHVGWNKIEDEIYLFIFKRHFQIKHKQKQKEEEETLTIFFLSFWIFLNFYKLTDDMS
jgi:hypothetical protein